MLEYNKIFLILSHIFVFTSFVLVLDWVTGGSKENNLGGLYPISMTNEQSNSYQYVFNWHPFMMVTGMLFCVVEAILSFQTFHSMNSLVFYGIRLPKLIHIFWQTIAMICMIVGLIAVFDSHNYPVNGKYKANFYSLHSWIGIFTVSLYTAQYFVSLVTFLSPFQNINEAQKKKILPYHIYFGIALLLLITMAIETGIQEKSTLSLNCAAHYPTNIENGGGYSDLPLVCQKANWLGMTTIASVLFTGLTLYKKKETLPITEPLI